jgi:hypothetical protein
MRQREEQEEISMERRLLLATVLMVATTGATAFAQTTPTAPAAPAPPAAAPAAPAAPTPPMAPPERVRGTIAGFAGNVLTVKSGDGQKLEITLKDPVTVRTVKKVKLTAIEPNSFIGTTTRTGADGKMTAIEVHVFPEAMRGTGEGSRPWDLGPGTTMTNATVTGEMKAAKGREFTLSYKDMASGTVKTSTVYVPPSAPIVTFAPATATDLKPGAKVFVIAMKGPDGKLTAPGVTVATHGVAPPM